MNSTFSLLIVFLTQLFMPRHNAQLRLLKAQIQILRNRIPTQRIILSPEEKAELLRIGAECGHDIDGLLEVGPIVQDSTAEAQMSWIMALIVGGGTGRLVARLSGHAANPLPAIVLGVIGAAIGSYLVTLLGLRITVRLDQLVAGALGALILVLIVRR